MQSSYFIEGPKSKPKDSTIPENILEKVNTWNS